MVRPWTLFPRDGDETERELRAQLQAERMAVSRLRDEAHRLVGHVQSLQVQLQAERAAVSRLEEGVLVYKTEAASAQQKIVELKEKNSRDGDVENKAGKTHIIELAETTWPHEWSTIPSAGPFNGHAIP